MPSYKRRHTCLRGRHLAGLLGALALVACADDTDSGVAADTFVADVPPTLDVVDTVDNAVPDTHEPGPETVEVDTFVAPETSFPEVDPALVAVAVNAGAPPQVRAGEAFVVDYLVTNTFGDAVSLEDDVPVIVATAPTSAVSQRADGSWVAEGVGTLHASCAVPALALIDDVGVDIEVVPGPAAFVVTWLDRTTVIAGEDVIEVACEAYDEFGNVVSDVTPGVSVTPTADEEIVDGSVAFTSAGTYAISCDVDGANADPQEVLVSPNLPASFAMARSPSQSVVATNTIIVMSGLVADRYGNAINDADVRYVSDPVAAEELGEGRFSLQQDGTYTLIGTVFGPTDDDVELERSLTVKVNGSGPTITCSSGVMKDVSLGSDYNFSGSVSDPSGVSWVKVNGSDAPVSGNGSFSASITPRFGMNFVEVTARDVHGKETSRLCTLLMADHWVGRTSFLDESVMVRLDQNAVDDGNRSGVDDSLADVVDTVLDSQAFEDFVEGMVKGAGTSGSQCIGVKIGGTCIGGTVSWTLKIDRLTINGNSSVSLDLKSGSGNKIGMNVTLRNVDIRIKITGTLNTTVTAKVSSLTLTMTGGVSLSGGKLNFNVTSGPSANVSATLDTSLPNWIDSIINSFVQGRVESEVEDAVEDAAESAIEPLLDGVLGNLDIGALGGSFNVPKLAGGSANLTVALRTESVSVSNSRLLVGISTKITSPTTAVYAPTLGVPLTSASAYTSAYSAQGEARAAANIGLINQTLTTLWKAGFIDGDLDDLAGSSLPNGASVSLTSRLPPVARMRSDGKVEFGLGGLRLRVELPGLFEGSNALEAEVGALARTTPSLVGNTLKFSSIILEEFKFSTDVQNLDPTTRETLEDLFRDLMKDITASALNDALPALPIPNFDIPSNSFGLSGTLLLYQPTLTQTTNHFLLSGKLRRQ